MAVHARDAAKVMKEFSLESLSSTQVSRAAALLDEELEAWRIRGLDPVKSLILDARYEKVRADGIVRDATILSAIGVCLTFQRRCRKPRSTGADSWTTSWTRACAASNSSSATTMPGCVRPARQSCRASSSSAARSTWPRTPSTTRPTLAIRKHIGEELRAVWNAKDLAGVQAERDALVESDRTIAPKRAQWLETNVPESFSVFTMPRKHRRRIRISNPIALAVQQEIKCRTRKVSVFQNETSRLRLITAILAKIDEDWATTDRVSINMEDRDD